MRLPGTQELRSPLARRLVVAVVLFSSAITLALTAFQLYRNYRTDLSLIDDELAQIERVHVPSIVNALWATDLDAVRLQLDGMLLQRDMHHLEVSDEGAIVVSVGAMTSRNFIVREFPLRHIHRGQSLRIGTLTATATLDGVYRRLIDAAIVILLSNAVKTFLVAVFIVVLFHFLVGRYLFRIEEYAGRANSEFLDEPIDLKRSRRPSSAPDEIDRLVAALNGMRENLRRSRDQLATSERYFRNLFEHAHVGILLIDPESTRIVDANQQAAALIGLDRDELLHMTIMELGPPAAHDQAEAALRKLRATGETMFERILRHKHGRTVPVEVSSRLVDLGARKVIVSFVRDLSERKHAERELRESEAKYRTLVEQSPAVTYIADMVAEVRMLYMSPQIEALLGYPIARWIGQADFFSSIIHPDDRLLVFKLMEEARDCPDVRPVVDMEYRVYDAYGNMHWFRDRAISTPDHTGNRRVFRGTILDITALKQAEAEAARLGRILDESSNEIYMFRADNLRFLNVNEGALRNLGYSRSELREMTPLDLKSEHTRETFEQLLVPLRRHERDLVSFETFHRRKDGSTYPVEVRLHLSHREEPELFVAVIMDISARLRAEQALRAERDFNSAVLETVGSIVVVLDREGRITRFNRACEQLTGYRFDEVHGRYFWDFLLPPEQVEAVRGAFAALTTDGLASHYQNEWLTRDGERRMIEWSNTTLCDVTGAVEYIIATGIDITERALGERTLRDTTERFRQAMRAARSGAWEWNIATNEVIWTEENYAVLGLRPDIGPPTYNTWINCVHPNDRERSVREIEEALETRSDLNLECRIVRPDGEVRWISDVGRIVLDENERPVSMYGIQIDITERKQGELEREKLLTELTARNAEMENFVYTISHDLKSPLITIGGFAGLLQRDLARGEAANASDSIAEILKAVADMQNLINDLLALSRTGRVVGELEPVALNVLVDEVLGQFKERIRTAHARVTPAPELPVIHADRARMAQVLQNLIDNALKYTRDGVDPVIEIGSERGDGELRIFVRDNGRGIKQEYHERVFGLFQRVDTQTEGTGVGLAITRRIIEVHGGRMWVESEPGRGSTFWISFPDSVSLGGGGPLRVEGKV